MPQEPMGKVWQNAITVMYENPPRGEPKPGAIKIRKAFDELIKNGKMLAPAPSERAIGRHLVKVRNMSDEERSRFREVRWPDSYLDKSLPWEAAPKVLATARSYYPNRVLLANAQWAWRIYESRPAPRLAPEVDWSECWYAAKYMAAWEASPGQNGHIPEAVEDWLLRGGKFPPIEINPNSTWAGLKH